MAAILVGFGLWWFLRDKSIDWHAGKVAQAMIDGNGSTMLSYTHPEQIKSSKLTADQLEAVWHRIVQPAMNGWSATVSDVETQADGGNAVAVVRFQKGAATISVWAQVHQTDNGPKTDAVFLMLAMAWALRMGTLDSDPVDMHRTWAGRQKCLIEDKVTLLEIGIPGMTQNDSKLRLLDWDAIASRYEERSRL